MTRKRRVAGNLLLLALSTGLCLALMEFAARQILSARRPGKSGEQALYTDFDPVLGWRNRPGASLTYDRREFQTTVQINALGFRDVEHPVTTPAGLRRILVLGDSFIEAYAVERDQGLTRRIETIANQEGCGVDVVNAGVHGYSTDQEYLWYERESAALKPDVVVMALYYNDILNTVRGNYWGSPKPVLEMRDGVLAPINTPLPAPPPSNVKVTARTVPTGDGGSALKYLLIERLLTGAPRLISRLADMGVLDPIEPEGVADELRVYKRRPKIREVESAWERTAEIIRAFEQTARSRNARPVLAYIPSRFEVMDADWDLTALTYSMNPDAWDRYLVPKKLEEVAKANRIPFLDFTKDLRDAAGPLKGSPYFQFDGHWNAFGNDVAATTAVSFLKSQNLLTCANR